MRKRVQSQSPALGRDASRQGALDLDKLATVIVTSEQPDNPIEHALLGPTGRESSRWVAGESGRQVVTLAFDAPQQVAEVSVEIEDLVQERTQQLELEVSRDGERSYQVVVRQEFNFSPSGTTWERETWRIGDAPVTHVRLSIVPHKGGGDTRAMLTSLILR